jgi:hypothetical protein
MRLLLLIVAGYPIAQALVWVIDWLMKGIL